MDFWIYDSPIGKIKITGGDDYVDQVLFVDGAQTIVADTAPREVEKCIDELDRYFKGELKRFTVNVKLKGTAFQQKVWRLLQEINYGETISYLELALRHGDRKAIRAVGKANGLNPAAVIVPCHRVVGQSGKLVGYAGGLARKQWLLNHEHALTPQRQTNLFGQWN